MRASIGIAVLALALMLGACTAERPVRATVVDDLMLLTEPLQLTGGDTGHEVLAWRPSLIGRSSCTAFRFAASPTANRRRPRYAGSTGAASRG